MRLVVRVYGRIGYRPPVSIGERPDLLRATDMGFRHLRVTGDYVAGILVFGSDGISTPL